jgi:hypothetical protein
VISTTQFGNLRASDVQNLHGLRIALLGVLRTLSAAEIDVRNRAESAGSQDPAQRRAQQEMASMEANQRVAQLFGSGSQEEAINIWLLSNYAESLKMVVTNETINNFIGNWTEGQLKADAIHEVILRSMSDELFFRLMREELLAMQIGVMFQKSIVATTPGQRWDYFNRQKRMAEIEAVAFPVADFAGQIEAPTDAKLEAFFEKYKDSYPSPVSAQPGFRKPHRIALAYVQADVNTIAKSVTDQEVLAQYEKRKSDYDQVARYLYPETQPSQTPPVAEKEIKKAPTKETPKPPAKGSEKPVAGTLGVPSAAAKAKTPAAAPAAGKAPVPPAAAPAAGTPPVPPTPPQQKAPDPAAKDPAAKPAETKPPAKVSKQETGDAGQVKKPAKPVAAAGGVAPAAPVAPSAPPAPKQPSEQLKAFIRNELAVGRIDKLFQPIREEVIEYSDARGIYEADKAKLAGETEGAKRELPPPPEPNYAKLTQQPGLSFHRIGLMSQWQVRDTDIGQSIVGEALGPVGGPPLFRYAFDLGKFSPKKSGTRPDQLSPLWNDRYLFWKTEDERDQVPKFGAVRDEVLAEWKLVEARKPAMQKAESLADEARKAHKSLHALLADQPKVQVLKPPKFSWLPAGREERPSDTGVSEVKGLKLPGTDFMRAVFGSEPGGTAAAFNAPQTIAYAIYLDQTTPSFNVRWEEFQFDPFSNYQAVARDDMVAMRRAWIAEIKHSVGFKELVKPQQPSRPPDDDSDEPIDFGGG